MLSGAVLEVRERVLAVVREVAELTCECEPDAPCLACRAAAVLEYLTTAGFRMVRWRNAPGPVIRLVHTAGVVIACREYRRSCPGYIVDRRQTCVDCGHQLGRGTWGLFWDEGEAVAELLERTSGRGSGISYRADGQPGEIPCTRAAKAADPG